MVLKMLREFAVQNDEATLSQEQSETGSNRVFKKKAPPMELMEEIEKTEENGAELDRREVEVRWILK